MNVRPFWLGGALLCLVVSAGCAPTEGGGGGGSGDASSAATPTAALGSPDSLLFWRGAQQREGYRHMDRVFPTRVIEAGGDVLPLPERPVDLSGLTFESGGQSYDVDGFMEASSVVGLLVLQDGDIVLERYAEGNDASSLWVSYSVSKSVVSLLVGAAVRDGYIPDLDVSVAEYVPALEGTSYEPVTIRQALQMASGVQWSDAYDDPNGDIAFSVTGGTLPLLRRMGSRERVADPGTRFNYNSGETHLLGTVLRSAIGNNLATYLSSEIWRPFGMEADGNWLLVEPDGGEHGGCCFSATLRDYGRLGLFAMGGGRLADGEPVLADGWMEEATSPSPANPGYGYLWWLQPNGAYAAIGIFGQMIWVDPEARVVVVTHSAWEAATPHFARGYAFARAVTDLLEG